MNKTKTNSFITLIGFLLLLLGIYATTRTGVNLFFFKKYPTTGVLSINLMGFPPYSQRDEDCFYPQLYFAQDGESRDPSEAEKKYEEQLQLSCINGIQQSRESTKINDISVSLLLLFLGTGVLAFKRFIV
ncbi:hypothetical protein KJ654_00880 [Patescibacteria group bacterium]|nr:hypothetical protein [Patescibacteria group bacterium]